MTDYIPTPATLVGVPVVDSRGRATLKKWIFPETTYHAHRFDDGSILLVAV